MEKASNSLKFLGILRLTGIFSIIALLVMTIDWSDSLDWLIPKSIGGIIAVLSVLCLVYYQIKKGLNEFREIKGFENNKLQNFSVVYSIIILVLFLGNLYISESKFELNAHNLIMGLIALFIIFFAIVDVIELWKGNRN